MIAGSAISSPRRALDGVLLLDKPLGITSSAAVQRVKRLFHALKAGHVGTLDPLASGLLPVCFGEATKFSSGMFDADKAYVAEVMLGVTTTTGDAEGEVTSRHAVAVTQALAAQALLRFTGTIQQTPPIYSALKRDGKPLYAYARRGEHVDIEPRSVTVHGIELLEFAPPRLRLRVRCGKGTYIRVLAEDLGRELGCGGSLAGLRRVTVGPYEIERSVTLDALEAMQDVDRDQVLMPVDSMVSALMPCLLDPERARQVVHGRTCHLDPAPPSGWVRLYGPGRHFLGVGEILAGGQLAPRRMVASHSG